MGIEHASKEVLEEALNNLITYNKSINSITNSEFDELGLSGKKDSVKKREIIAKEFHTGKCNSKTMFKRLNMLGISAKQIEKII